MVHCILYNDVINIQLNIEMKKCDFKETMNNGEKTCSLLSSGPLSATVEGVVHSFQCIVMSFEIISRSDNHSEDGIAVREGKKIRKKSGC